MIQKRWWIFPRTSEDLVDQVLQNRGIVTKDRGNFLIPNYDEHQNDPFLFKEMAKAVELIISALHKRERIGIFADYDADGIPAAALLDRILKILGILPIVTIPTREDGYGLNQIAVKNFEKEKVKLIITLDCGIRDVEAVAKAKKLGIKVIIIDHHEVGPILPKAVAIINPKVPGEQYPFRDLCGCAVAFKLAQALAQKCGSKKLNQQSLKWQLDLVALSTIADLVPLRGENRLLAKYGLMVLRKTRNIGLQKMMEDAQITKSDVGPYQIGFMLAPRINSPNRMGGNVNFAFELLTTDSPARATYLAAKLSKLNQARQKLLDQAITLAVDHVESQKLNQNMVIILAHCQFNRGIAGLIASRIAEKYYRPTIVLGIEKDQLTGSARSIEDYSILDALEFSQKYLVRFGGHKMAAGLTLNSNNYENFKRQILKHAKEKIGPKILIPKIKIDAEILFNEIDNNLYRELEKLEPHGIGNPRPVFITKNLNISQLRRLSDNKHLKLIVVSNLKSQYSAIGFNISADFPDLEPGHKIDLVYQLNENEWNGNVNLELRILDLRPTEINQ